MGKKGRIGFGLNEKQVTNSWYDESKLQKIIAPFSVCLQAKI